MHSKPDPQEARDFAYKIALLYLRHPFSVTSWFRSPSRNALVGGTPHSKHLAGLAVDIVPDATTPWSLVISQARALGLVVVEEADHLHLEEGGNRYRPTSS